MSIPVRTARLLGPVPWIGRLRLGDLYASGKLLWALAATGVALRIGHYAINPTLFIDEVRLVLNVQGRSLAQLAQPLDYEQGAPLGFLFAEKAAEVIFGESEYAFRLVPLIAGVAALLLFVFAARLYLPPAATPVAVGLFAISYKLTYYSFIVKQYSLDVLFAVILTLVFARAIENRLSGWQFGALALLGAVAVWFSHPVVFVLGAMGLCLGVKYLVEREWGQIAALAGVGALWLASFGVAYFLSLRSLYGVSYLLTYWDSGFLRIPPSSLAEAVGTGNSLVGVFKDPLGVYPALLGALCFVVGNVVLFRRHRTRYLMLVAPVALTVLASALQKYPFSGRMLLFLCPALALVVAGGAVATVQRVRAYSPYLALVVAVALLGPTVAYSAAHQRDSMVQDDVKPVMEYISENARNGDTIFLSYGSQYQYRYYAGQYSWPETRSFVGLPHLLDLNFRMKREAEMLAGGPRVWMMFLDWELESGFTEFGSIDDQGVLLDSFHAGGVSAYLFDLRPLRPASSG